MRRSSYSGLMVLALALVHFGCGDSEGRLDSGTKDGATGAGAGSDTGFLVEAGIGVEAGRVVDVPATVDVPLTIDGGPRVDAGLGIDVSLAVDLSLAVDVAGAVDVVAAVEVGAIDAAPCVVLPKRFDADTVLPKGCYLAESSPIIAAAVRLTLSPGVTIIFSQNTGLSISAEEVLIADGTAAEPILLTGAQRVRGFWKGISFDGVLKSDSVLDYVIVEYAGRTQSDANAAGVKLTADSRGVRATITNTTIRESQGWGLSLNSTAVLGGFAGNTLTKNTLGPARVSSEVVKSLDATSTYKGNDRDQLVVDSQYISTASAWAALDVPYFIDSGIRVSADWTIAPGTTLVMAKGSELDISGDAASLVADGTAAKPILFTGETQTRGTWTGITFSGSNNTRNSLNYVTVEYAGNTTADADSAAVKLAADSHGAQAKISNTTLRQSQAWGLYLTGSAIVPGFAGNILTLNKLGPAKVGSTAAHQLLTTSSYIGNDVDQLYVAADWVSAAVTWQAINVPYLINGSLRPQAVWTLAPGVTLLMGPKAWISVAGDECGMHAVGTAAAPIVITGSVKTPGSWENIIFDNTNNGANAFDHCTIEYGGGGTAKGYAGMIDARSDSHRVGLSVTNSTIRQSAVWGIYMGMYADVTLTNNTYADNALGATYKEP